MWFVFAIATTLIWGLTEFFYKKGARPNEKFAHLKISVCVGFVMGLHAIFTLLTQEINYNPINLIRYFPVSFLYIGSMTFSFFGMRFIEESISDPIENTSGAICTLLCVVFLGKKLSVKAVIAIFIILIGVLGIGFLESREDRKKKIGKLAAIAFMMPFLYAILDAIGSFLDVYYLSDVNISPLVDITEETIELVANVSYEISFYIFAIILLFYMKMKNVKFDMPRQSEKIAAAVCETAGQLTYVYAMSGNGAVAAPIISSVCVVSLLLSRIFLKEKLSLKQYIFIAFVIVGIIVLSTIS